MARRPTLDYLRTESGSGLILAVAALAAIVIANSPWAHRYGALVGAPLTIQSTGNQDGGSVTWSRLS